MSVKTLAPMPTSLALSALLLSAPAWGADAPAATQPTAPKKDAKADAKTENLDEVVVKGQAEKELSSPKYTQSLKDTPQTVTVVDSAVIQQQGVSTLAQVLKNSPGISMQAGEGGVPNGDNLSIRGFNARTDMFIDGVRDFGGYARDPFNLEQVEIVKGPSSVNGGRGSTGGSINLVTKQAQQETFYTGSVAGGTDDYKRMTLDVNQSLDNGDDKDGIKGAALRINAMTHDADMPGRDHVTNQRMGVAPTMTFGLGSPTQFSIGFFHMTENDMPDYGIPFVPANKSAALGGRSNQLAPVPYNTFYGLLSRDYEHIKTDVGSMTLNHDFENGVTLRNHTQYGVTSRDSVATAPRFTQIQTNPANTQLYHELQSRDQTDTNLTNQLDLTFKFDTGPVKHTLVTGGEFSFENEVNYARAGYAPGTNPNTSAPLATAALLPTTAWDAPDAYQPTPYSIQRTGARTKTSADSQALYLFDTVDLNKQWSVMGGVRWDRFNVDFKNTASTFTGGAVTDLGRTDNMFSYRGGLTYKPAENGAIYGAVGTSFNPSAEGLTLANPAPGANTSANSINVAPEQSISYELGTKWNLMKDKLLLSAALFDTDKTNARTSDPTDPTSVTTLNGKQRVYGIELGATGNLTKEWTITAGYAHMESEVLSSDNQSEVGRELANCPADSASLWTVYAFPFKLDLGAGATFVGSRWSGTTTTPATAVNGFNSNTPRDVDGYVTFDAMAAYHVSSHFTMRLNVYNLADKDYIGAVSGGHAVPGAGRSAVLSGEFKF